MNRVKPILFNTRDVRAILNGRKTVTRRVVKPHYKSDDYGWRIVRHKHNGEIAYVEYYDEWEASTRRMELPYEPGDVMYVREAWDNLPVNPDGSYCGYDRFYYKADLAEIRPDGWNIGWKPSVTMPKRAARIFLRVTNVRVERLQDVTEDDAIGDFDLHPDAIKAIGIKPLCKVVWNSAIKKSNLDRYGWEANPYVWVIAFERCEKAEKREAGKTAAETAAQDILQPAT